MCTLTPYQFDEVDKFVFEGNEKFHELPQTFFHYVAWISGGKEMVCDLQGSLSDEGELTLIDPVLIRAGTNGVWDRITCAPPNSKMPLPPLFDVLHPRCGQMCKSFDPSRAVKARRIGCGQLSCSM